MNTKRIITLSAMLAALAGCAGQSTVRPESAAAPSPQGACATNFTTEGSFWTGMRYSTFEEFPKKTVSGTFDALLQSVASSGYQVNSSSKEAGMISASQTVSYGQGKTVPLNFVIQKSPQSGVRVDVSLSTSGGVSGSADGVQKEFCKLLATVEQSPNQASAAPKTAEDSASAPKKRAKKSTAP